MPPPGVAASDRAKTVPQPSAIETKPIDITLQHPCHQAEDKYLTLTRSWSLISVTTEIKESFYKVMQLTPTMQKYILHWGEMGTRWGVNRTVAQIHALLYLSERPLHAEEITETLNVARSNVS